MKTPIAVLALLALAAVYDVAQAQTAHTYVSNQSSETIVATTSYPSGKSQFINRVIAPGTYQGDQYFNEEFIHVELWVEGAGQHNSITIDADDSIVGFDHGDGSTGVDIYRAVYGTLTQPTGPILVTIYLN